MLIPMLIPCPQCRTVFKVETDDMHTGGRRVRCSVCQHVWHAHPDEGQGAEQNTPHDMPHAMPQNTPHDMAHDMPQNIPQNMIHDMPQVSTEDASKPHNTKPHRTKPHGTKPHGTKPHGTKLWQSLVIVCLLASALASGITLYRTTLSAMLPWLKPIYQSLGMALAVDLTAFEIAELHATRQRDTVRISGMVRNITPWPAHAPHVLATITDQAGRILAEKTITPEDAIIEGKNATAFIAQVVLEEPLADDVLTDIITVPIDPSDPSAPPP